MTLEALSPTRIMSTPAWSTTVAMVKSYAVSMAIFSPFCFISCSTCVVMRLASLCTDMMRRYGSDPTSKRKIDARFLHLHSAGNAVFMDILKVLHDE